MRHINNPSFCAALAISAALALGSTPAFAQEAAAPAPIAPAPTIVLPSTIAEPAAPASAEEPSARPSAAARTERAAPRRAERAAEPAPAPRADPAPAETVAGGDVPVMPVMAPVAQPAAAPPVADARQPDAVPRAIDVPDEIIAASVLGVLGLAIAGFVATRRRRPDEELYDDAYEPQPEHVAGQPITSIPDELAVSHAPAAVPVSERSFAMPAGAMPAGAMPTGAARQRLLDEMVAAAPDEANPFTSIRARRKRARIILQSRESRQQDQQASEPFDWRPYRSSATPDPATPPMVDA